MQVLFVTGAGISANAGIPTYRDKDSSWTNTDLEQKSHASRYGNHLDELWDEHWGPMVAQMLVSEPTYAHRAIAAFQQRHDAIVATQNIDILHERAGSDNIAHLHGSAVPQCMRCKSSNIGTWMGHGAPECRDCDSRKVRLDVVLFGENLDRRMFKGLERFAREVSHIVAVGTSLNVYPAAGLVMDNSRKTVIINKEPTAFDRYASSVHHGDSDELIDEVLDLIVAS